MFLKNFWTVLKHYRLSFFINVFGLTLAMAAFYIMGTQIWYSITYNKSLKNSDRTYLILAKWGGFAYDDTLEWSYNSPSPISKQAAETSPLAEVSTHFRSYPYPTSCYLKTDAQAYERFDFGTYDIGVGGVDLFGFDPIAGDLMGIAEPNTVIVSDYFAELAGLSVGDEIYYGGGQYYNDISSKQSHKVVGIFKAFGRNTFLYGHHIFKNDNCVQGQENNNWNYSNFVRLSEGADPQLYKKVWQDFYYQFFKSEMVPMIEEWNEQNPDDQEVFTEEDMTLPIKLVPLDEMYYQQGSNFSTNPAWDTSTPKSTVVMCVISLIIILIALFNFVNFCMGMVPFRIKNVNISKVMGASQSQLRTGLLFEAFALTVISFVCALLLVYLLKDGFVKEYVTSSLEFGDNIPLVIIMFMLMLILSLAGALYPAMYITKVKVAMAVKDGFAGSAMGRRIRNILVGVQFAAAMILIIVSGVFTLQYRYMVNYDIGFNKDNLLAISSISMINIDSETFISKLEQHPDVEGVTASVSMMVGESSVWGRTYQGKEFYLNAWKVMWNFPQVFGIEILEGEGFTKESHTSGAMLITQNLNQEIGVPLVSEINKGLKVVGIIPNVNFTSVAEGDKYAAIYCSKSQIYSSYYLRMRPGSSVAQMTDFVYKTIQELNPTLDLPVVSMYSNELETLYEKSKKEMVAVSVFALIAIVIALMGVVGVILFETAHRRGDIAIRKVYGATSGQMIRMFSFHYIKIVLICFVVAAPVAWVITSRYLDNFVHRIAMPWWLYLSALILVMSVTGLLVFARSAKAASENPVNVI